MIKKWRDMMDDIKILCIEDHESTAEMIQFLIEKEGPKVVLAHDGPTGERLYRSEKPTLIILDLMLPGIDGHELCRRIRQDSTVPILMLTARADDTDKAIGLGIGADDYLTKPFSPTELIARIKALLRRSYQYNETPKSNILTDRRLKLDVSFRELTIDNEPIDLTPTEFELLQTLMAHPGWTFTRAHLLEKIWGYDDNAGEATVTTHISNLRHKLSLRGMNVIRTVRSVGYAYSNRED
jgi:two-component system response regulator VicR